MKVEEIQKTTVAQQMAEKYLDEPNKKTVIPLEYQSYISKNQHFLFHLIQSYYILFLLFWG